MPFYGGIRLSSSSLSSFTAKMLSLGYKILLMLLKEARWGGNANRLRIGILESSISIRLRCNPTERAWPENSFDYSPNRHVISLTSGTG